MNIQSFDNLSSLNSFLLKEVENLKIRAIDPADLPEKLKTITKTIDQNVRVLTAQPLQSLQETALFLLLAQKIRAEVIRGGESCQAARPDLKNAIRLIAKQSIIKDTSLQQVRDLRHHSKKIYLKTLAAWIEQNKLPVNHLGLSDEEIKELAPYLTFLEIRGNSLSESTLKTLLRYSVKVTRFHVKNVNDFGPIWGSKVHFPRLEHMEFSNCHSVFLPIVFNVPNLQSLTIKCCMFFQGSLPKGMTRLKELTIEKCPQFSLSLPKDMKELTHLNLISTGIVSRSRGLPRWIKNLEQFRFGLREDIQTHHYLVFLKSLFKEHKEKALSWASAEGWSETALLLYFRFSAQNPQLTHAIIRLINHIDYAKLGTLLSRKDIPFVHQEEIQNDPIKQLLIYRMFSMVSEESFPALGEFLAHFINSTSNEMLSGMVNNAARTPNLDHVLDLAKKSPLPHDYKTLSIFAYLQFAEANHEIIIDNVTAAIQSFGLERAFSIIPPFPIIVEMLSHPSFFTGTIKHDFPLGRCLQRLYETGLQVFLEKPEKYLKLMKDHPGLEVYIRECVSTKHGRSIIKNNPDIFLNSQVLQTIVLDVYPIEQEENANLYSPLLKIGKTKHYLTYRQGTAERYPDGFLELLAQCPTMRRIDVRQYGIAVADEGGPGRGFFSELFMGIVERSEVLSFETCSDGKLTLSAKTGIDEEVKSVYKTFGALLGMAARLKYPVGEYFSPLFFQCLRSFSSKDLADLAFSGMTFLQGMDDRTLIDYMRLCTKPSGTFEIIEEILFSEDLEAIKEKADNLNAGWCEDDLAEAIAQGDCNAIKANVRKVWLSDYCGYVECAHTIAMGMIPQLPWHIDGSEIANWDDLQSIPIEKLALHIQGELSYDLIRRNIKVGPVKNPKAALLSRWVIEWVDARADDEKALVNLVKTITGAATLSGCMRFYLTDDPEIKGPKVQTCSKVVFVPENIEKESFILTLDSWGRGENCIFNTL